MDRELALLHELGSFMHIDFSDCYACNWNKQTYWFTAK